MCIRDRGYLAAVHKRKLQIVLDKGCLLYTSTGMPGRSEGSIRAVAPSEEEEDSDNYDDPC